MTQLTGIDHIDIVVDDPEAMAAFYLKAGFTVVRRTDHGGGSVELRFPGEGEQPILELVAAKLPDGTVRPLGLRHIAMRCEDIDQTHRALTDAGFAIATPPRKIAATGRTLFNLTDPAGGSLQIVGA